MESTLTPSLPRSGGARLLRALAHPQPQHLLWTFIGLMYVYVLWNNERFLFDSKHPEWAHIESFKWWMLPHGLAAAFSLFLGPLQFSEGLRRRFARAHRIMGRLYVLGVFIGAPLGVYIQYFEEGLGASRSFTFAAVADAALWMFTTGMALFFILRGRVQQHRQWMTRSFAGSLVFLEVRTIINLTGWGQYAEIIVWCCVAAAIPLADFVLQFEESRKLGAARTRTQRLAPQPEMATSH